MPSIAFSIPVRPGKEDNSKELIGALTGDRGEAVHDRRREHGFRRIKVWRQSGNPTVDIVYLEADDLEAAMRAVGEDQHEHNQWVSQMVEDMTGHRPGAGQPHSQLLLDWHPAHGHSTQHHD